MAKRIIDLFDPTNVPLLGTELIELSEGGTKSIKTPLSQALDRLYFGGSAIVQTDSTGITVFGDIVCDDLFTSGDTIHVGSGQIKSTGGNIELFDSGNKVVETYHDGANQGGLVFDADDNILRDGQGTTFLDWDFSERAARVGDPVYGNLYVSSVQTQLRIGTKPWLNLNSTTQIIGGTGSGESRITIEQSTDTVTVYTDGDNTLEIGNSASRLTGDLTVEGDFFVDGTTWVVNNQEVTTSDNLIVINHGETGPGVTAGQAGIEVDRGQLTNYQFMFVEASDTFRIGEIGSLQAVATREDSPINNGIAIWNDSEKRFDTVASVSGSVNHNETLGLQGGDSTSEFYHLTQAIHDGLYSGSPLIGLGTDGGTSFEVDYGSNEILANIGSSNVMKIYTDGETDLIDLNGQVTISGGQLLMSTNIRVSGNGTISSHGGMQVGQNDSIPGLLEIFGGGIGEEGGTIKIYNATDQDDPVENWSIRSKLGEDNLFLTYHKYVLGMGLVEYDLVEFDTTGIIVTGDIYCDDLYTSGDTIHVGSGQIKSTAGNVELYNSDQKIIETTDDGLKVQAIFGGDLRFYLRDQNDTSWLTWRPSQGEAQLGKDISFNMRATNSQSEIRNGVNVKMRITDTTQIFGELGSGDLNMTVDQSTKKFRFDMGTSDALVMTQYGSVEIYHNAGGGGDEKVFETISSGIKIADQVEITADSTSITIPVNIITTEPSEPEHVATKAYVDAIAGGETYSGKVQLNQGDTTANIVYDIAQVDSNYSIVTNIVNKIDPNPSLFIHMTTTYDANGFTELFSGPIDSDNYELHFIISRNDVESSSSSSVSSSSSSTSSSSSSSTSSESSSSASETSLTFTVAADADDGRARLSTFFSTNSLHAGNLYYTWIRFTNLTIPPGATITSAFLRVRQDGSESGAENCDARIRAHDVGDGYNPTVREELQNADPSSPGPSGWTTTTAFVDWDNIPAVGSGSFYNSPDIKTVIQEIVDRGDWSSGNAITLHLDPKSSPDSREWTEAVSQLLVTYI